MINTPEDLAVLRYWGEHTTYRPAPEEALHRRPWLEDLGIVLCYLPRTPFMELVVNLAGISNVVALWSDARDDLEETLAVMERSSTEAAEAALQVPADAFMIPENLSSEVVGRYYAKYVVPVEREWVGKIQEAGKYAFIHMDGTLRGLMRQVAETGFDVIEAMTPAPTGDVAIEEARRVAGPSPILWGGIPGAYFTELVSDHEFDRHVREVLEVMVSDRRMVLGVADQVPPDGLPRRIARVAELVGQHGAF
jgi:uroporphyrinogen-III decarboxylase